MLLKRKMECGQETSINSFYQHKSSVCKPLTIYLDSSSSPSEKSAVTSIITLPSRSKETDADLSYKERDSSWSFIKFISLAEVFVFIYHVILLAKEGVTVDWYGPAYTEVKQNAIFDKESKIIMILEPSDT